MSTLATAVLADDLAVALDPAPVVGVLGLQALQVGGALGELAAQLVGDVVTEAVGRRVRRRRAGGRGWPPAAGSRTSPVSGSMRRLSRTTGSVLLGLALLGSRRWRSVTSCSSSSTISASTTSSSPSGVAVSRAGTGRPRSAPAPPPARRRTSPHPASG